MAPSCLAACLPLSTNIRVPRLTEEAPSTPLPKNDWLWRVLDQNIWSPVYDVPGGLYLSGAARHDGVEDLQLEHGLLGGSNSQTPFELDLSVESIYYEKDSFLLL